MIRTESLRGLGLDQGFPEQLFVVSDPASGRFGCFCHKGVHGLACFRTEIGAVRFAEWIPLSGIQILEVSFDQAREIAKSRPMPVVSLMLLDCLEAPVIHYVR